MSKINKGRFFEDFSLGETIVHPLPRTISAGDVSLYIALTGSRFALHSSKELAKSMGYDEQPIDDVLLFHLAFAKSVIDVSLNAVANLGYAEVYFPCRVYVGDTINLASSVIGLKQNSNAKSGNVYVHSIAYNQHKKVVLSFKRWVMVHKKDHQTQSNIKQLPELLESVAIQSTIDIPQLKSWDCEKTGSEYFWQDYQVGERLNHPEGMTIDNSDHTLAAKLYQNNAKVHFDAHLMQSSPMGERLIYGGHVISLCRALSFNGLANAMWLYAINAGTHTNPVFAGDTIYCYSEVLEVIDHARADIGLLRLRTVGLKNTPSSDVQSIKDENNRYLKNVVLDLDYTLVIPKRIKE